MNAIFRKIAFASAAVLTLQMGSVLAQTYPNKPIRLIVPFGAGGASDTFARVVGNAMSERLGQPFIVENRTGAGGTVAANSVAKSVPDGYTLFIGDIGTHSIAVSLYPKLSYDPIREFIPISYSVTLPLVLVVNPSVQANDLRSLIALAKARPGKIDYASSGSGGISHLAVEMLKSTADIDIVHVPYKGGTSGLTDVMGGQVQIMIPSLSTALPYIRTGKLRALGTASAKRSTLLPDVPTLRESGLPNYVVEPWVGILAPAGTPKPVVDRLEREFASVLNLPQVREKLTAQGFEVIAGSGDAFANVIKTDVSRWAKIVQQSGAKVE